MTNVTITVTAREAEEILIGLRMREAQSKLTPQTAREARELRERLNLAFEAAFNWPSDPHRHAPNGEIRVTVTTRNRW